MWHSLALKNGKYWKFVATKMNNIALIAKEALKEWHFLEPVNLDSAKNFNIQPFFIETADFYQK